MIYALIWWLSGFVSALHWAKKASSTSLSRGDWAVCAMLGLLGPVAYLVCWVIAHDGEQ